MISIKRKVILMLRDVESVCNKWKSCDRKWHNSDGSFWCNEECVRKYRKAIKVFSADDGVYILYADGIWIKRERK